MQKFRNAVYFKISMHSYHHQLNEIIDNSLNQIKEISKSDFDYKASPSVWSKKEILGHLIDSAYNNHQRFLRAVNQKDLVFQGYKQDDWVLRNNYQNRSKEDVLHTWASVNRHLSFLIKELPLEALTRETKEHNFHKICMNLLQEGQSASLAYLVWDYLFHLEHHLKQIIPNYRKLGEEEFKVLK